MNIQQRSDESLDSYIHRFSAYVIQATNFTSENAMMAWTFCKVLTSDRVAHLHVRVPHNEGSMMLDRILLKPILEFF